MFWTERWLLSQWLNQYLLQLVLEKQIRFLCSSKINLQNKTNNCLKRSVHVDQQLSRNSVPWPITEERQCMALWKVCPILSWARKAASATFCEHVFYWSPHTSFSQELAPWQIPLWPVSALSPLASTFVQWAGISLPPESCRAALAYPLFRKDLPCSGDARQRGTHFH